MRIAIAGGHGTIAMHLTRVLSGRGDEVASLIRNPDHSDDVRDAGGKPVIVDLEQQDGSEIAAAIGNADALVFAAGAGPDSGAERKETVDHQGAVKLLEAGRELGAQRYLMISSMGADSSHTGDEVFDVYLRAKGRADDAVREGGIPFVIVRPGALTDDEPTGKIELGESVGSSEIPRTDVAALLAELLGGDAPSGMTVEVVSGDEPIADAVARIA